MIHVGFRNTLNKMLVKKFQEIQQKKLPDGCTKQQNSEDVQRGKEHFMWKGIYLY